MGKLKLDEDSNVSAESEIEADTSHAGTISVAPENKEDITPSVSKENKKDGKTVKIVSKKRAGKTIVCLTGKPIEFNEQGIAFADYADAKYLESIIVDGVPECTIE